MPAQPTELETYFLELVNAARAEADVPPLTFDDELMVAADDHSAWMDATDTVSHTGADDSSPEGRIAAAGYEATGTGENISLFYGTDETGATAAATTHFVEELHEGFMDSPEHYQNLVNPDFQDVGISLIEGDYQGSPAIFVTQDFGTPESDDIFIA
jgi:serralysin